MVLAFKWGAVPVRIHATFLIIAALLGLTLQRTPLGVALWSAALVVTVLLHELGHALTARAFGVAMVVDVTPFGPTTDPRLAGLVPLRRALVALAGPTVSLAFGALATVACHWIDPARPILAAAIHHLAWIGVGWGALNLVPMLPFDGGYLLLAIADRITGGHGEHPIRLGSAAFAVVLAIASLVAHFAFPALLCGLLALQNARALRARETENWDTLARAHVTAGRAAIESDEVTVAIHHCAEALRMSSAPAVRSEATRVLAYAYALTGTWRSLVRLLESEGAVAMDDAELEKYERAARELGRVADAERIAQIRTGYARAVHQGARDAAG